jgi:hypothetical protein
LRAIVSIVLCCVVSGGDKFGLSRKAVSWSRGSRVSSHCSQQVIRTGEFSKAKHYAVTGIRRWGCK